MKKLIVLLFILVMAIPSKGQSSQGRYASRITPDGTIFFINPQKLGALTNLRRFEYDMTLLSWKDSVIINFTMETSWMTAPENFKLVSGDKVYPCENFSVLYTDIKKQHYVIRVTSKFSLQELTQIVTSTTSPTFAFTQNGVKEAAKYTDNAWKKERKKLLAIIQLYVYSKK